MVIANYQRVARLTTDLVPEVNLEDEPELVLGCNSSSLYDALQRKLQLPVSVEHFVCEFLALKSIEVNASLAQLRY